MASIVDTSVKNFNSTMTGAPVLSGTVGALVALLDAVLVNGFDLKTASSLTVAGGVASMAFTGSHSAQLDGVILIAGITGAYASLNGEQKVTAVGAGVVKFATNAADGTAAGTITFKMAPAGFEKPFLKANTAVYRSLDFASTRMLLRVDDTNATFARVVGYESMTDVDTGVGAFPTAAQVAGGGYWAKSTAASAVAVPWVVVADGRTLLIHIAAGVATSSTYVHGCTRGFGDAIQLKPGGDAYACFLNYSTAANSASMTDYALDSAQSTPACAFPRSYSGLGSSLLHHCLPYTGANSLSGIDMLLGTFPSEVDGSLKLSRRYFVNVVSGRAPRADCPGLLSVPQSLAFDAFRTGDRVPGAGTFAGRTLIAFNPTNSSFAGSPNNSNTGASFVDITGPWR